MEHKSYAEEMGEREIERKVKDVVDKREIGVIEEANEEAQKVYNATVKGETGGKGGKSDKEVETGDHKITLKKDFVLGIGESFRLKMLKDTDFEVVGASTPEMVAGEAANYPSIYGAIVGDLSHDETEDLPDGRKVKRKVAYGVGGVKQILEETVTDGREKTDTTALAAGSAGDTSTDAVIRRADTVADGGKDDKDKKASEPKDDPIIREAAKVKPDDKKSDDKTGGKNKK